MAAKTPPEITLELSGGALTIRTSEAIYRVVVAGGGGMAGPTALPAGPQPKAIAGDSAPTQAEADGWDDIDLDVPPPPSGIGRTGDEDAGLIKGTYDPSLDQEAYNEYYRDLSHDMYREIGAMAKRLSMSIRDVGSVNVKDMDLTSTGQQLEAAKGELQDVVKMTEQATMRIMDEGESIQEAVDRSQKIMDQLAPIRDAAQADQNSQETDGGQAVAQLAEALKGLNDYFAQVSESPLVQLSEQAGALLEQMQQAAAAEPQAADAAPEPEPAPQPAASTGPYFQFPIDVVFQTVYELCTNEAVKKHIKTMWDTQEQFDPAKVETALNEICPKDPDEDNFLNIDLKQVLKSLFQTTANEKFQGVLKKMAQTSDQIFLEQTLPLEAIPGEAPAAFPAPEPQAAPAPASAPAVGPGGPTPEMIEQMSALVEAIGQAAQAAVPPQPPGDLMDMLELALNQANEACNVIDPELLHQLTEAESLIRTSVNAIIESLSFQDLSGQTIYRIVRLLSDFQVQLLAMVVSFGSKLKAKESKSEITVDESEKLAQEEVDRVLGGLSSAEEEGADTEGRDEELDQGAVNNLLESLGF